MKNVHSAVRTGDLNTAVWASSVKYFSELGNVVTNYEAKTDACCISDVVLV